MTQLGNTFVPSSSVVAPRFPAKTCVQRFEWWSGVRVRGAVNAEVDMCTLLIPDRRRSVRSRHVRSQRIPNVVVGPGVTERRHHGVAGVWEG